MLIQGDCLEKLKDLPENSVDSIVTDPPYHLVSIVKRFGGKNSRNTPSMETKEGGVFARKAVGFMGKEWDGVDENGMGIAMNVELWAECLRVLKPGGYLLSFSGTRTYHRMATAIEDAGFEIRDMIEWVYGSGFPKSLNIGKAVDKLQGNEREVVGKGSCGYQVSISKKRVEEGHRPNLTNATSETTITKGTSDWEGWGTALKPAHEPICMARKPLSEKTVAENVLKWGTGGINIDESRVGTDLMIGVSAKSPGEVMKTGLKADYKSPDKIGRFPANLIHDNSEEVRDLFPDTGVSRGGQSGVKKSGLTYSANWDEKENSKGCGFGDSGNASRFFKSIIYQAKAPKNQRLLNGFYCAKLDIWKKKDENTEQAQSLVKDILGLVPMHLSIGGYGSSTTNAYPKDCISIIRTTISKITELKTWNSLMHSPTKDSIVDVFLKKTDGTSPVESAENSKELMTRIGIFQEKVGSATEGVKTATFELLLRLKESESWQLAYSHHPTHKPIDLMSYLIKMVTPKGGTVLDPFMGSGSTGVAANGFSFIGIELDPEYFEIAKRKIE